MSVLLVASGCKTSSAVVDSSDTSTSDAAADGSPSVSQAVDAAPAPKQTGSPSPVTIPASGPFREGSNHATISGKPFPAIDAHDALAAVRKTIVVKQAKANPDVRLGGGFLLREKKEDDRARWFVMRVENKTAKTEWAVRVVHAQFHDAADKPVGGGHNVQVHGSACDTQKNLAGGSHLAIPGVGAFMNDGCLAAAESGWAVVDLASEDVCAASRPCSPGAADIGSVELDVWTSSNDPGAMKAAGPPAVVGPASQLRPTQYEVSADQLSLVVTNGGPSPVVLFSAEGVSLDDAGDPLFFAKFTADRKNRIAPGGTSKSDATTKYRGPAATRLAAWTLFAEVP